MEKVKCVDITDENEDINPILSGIPVEKGECEPWRKARYSCSGAGRIEKHFDWKHLPVLERD